MGWTSSIFLSWLLGHPNEHWVPIAWQSEPSAQHLQISLVGGRSHRSPPQLRHNFEGTGLDAAPVTEVHGAELCAGSDSLAQATVKSRIALACRPASFSALKVTLCCCLPAFGEQTNKTTIKSQFYWSWQGHSSHGQSPKLGTRPWQCFLPRAYHLIRTPWWGSPFSTGLE